MEAARPGNLGVRARPRRGGMNGGAAPRLRGLIQSGRVIGYGMLRSFWPVHYRNLHVERNTLPKLGRINLLVGPNNSGKSNFIKAMGFLPDMLLTEGGPTHFLNAIDAHGRADVLNRTERAKKVKGRPKSDADFYLQWIFDSQPSPDTGDLFAEPHPPSDILYALSCTVGEPDSFPSGYYIRNEALARFSPRDWWAPGAPSEQPTFSVSCNSDGAGSRRATFVKTARSNAPGQAAVPMTKAELAVEANDTVLHQTKALLKDKAFYEKIFPDFDRISEELIGFARGFRNYSSTDLNLRKLVDGAKIDLGVRTLDAEGAEFVNVLRHLDQQHDFLSEEYPQRLRELIPDLKRIKIIDASDVYKQLELHIGGQKYKPREMSDGTLKALWLALLLFSPEKGSVLSIDEPELNLHPAWLKVVGGWLQRFTSAEQLFVSTHSPDLLDTFTDGFKSGDVALFVFGLGEKAMRRVDPAELESFFRDGWELGDVYRGGVPQLGGWPW